MYLKSFEGGRLVLFTSSWFAYQLASLDSDLKTTALTIKGNVPTDMTVGIVVNLPRC